MSTILSLTKRNIKMYTRDKVGVLLSLISVLIFVMLYFLFLGKMLESNFVSIFEELGIESNSTNVKVAANSLMIAGIIFMNSLNLPITILGRMAIDKSTKAIRDFYITPTSKLNIMFGYILSSIVITFVFNLITLVLGQGYILMLGGNMWSIGTIFMTLIFSTISIVIFSSLILLLLTFIKNETQLSVLSTTLGVLSGFISGLYVPFSFLSASIANILSILPFAGITSLIKSSLLGGAIEAMTKTAPQEMQEGLTTSLRELAGLDLYINGDIVSQQNTYISIFIFTLAVLSLTAYRLKNSIEK